MDTQDRLGKDRLGKDRLGKDRLGKDRLGKNNNILSTSVDCVNGSKYTVRHAKLKGYMLNVCKCVCKR